MSRVIRNPYWATPEKRQVMVEFHYEDGRILQAAVTNTPESEPNNPDWDEVLNSFTLEEIDANTSNVDQRKVAVNNNAMNRGMDRPMTVAELRVAPPNETTEQRRARHKALDKAIAQEEQDRDRQINEQLFQAKLDAFNIDVVKESTNRKIKSKIRKAKTIFEITAYTAYLIMENQIQDEQQSAE